MYLLDTNHCSYILQGNPDVCNRFQELGQNLVAICPIVQAELIFMAQNSQRKLENMENVRNFIQDIESYPITSIAAEIYFVILERERKLSGDKLNYLILVFKKVIYGLRQLLSNTILPLFLLIAIFKESNKCDRFPSKLGIHNLLLNFERLFVWRSLFDVPLQNCDYFLLLNGQ